MGLFRRKRAQPEAPAEKRASFRLPTGPSIPWPGTHAGVVVTTESALRTAAAWACIRVLKTSIAQLPVDQIRPVGKTRTEVDPPSPVVRSPAGEGTRRAWVAQQAHSMLTDGNAYGLVVAGELRPTQVVTVDPGCVRWQKNADGTWTVFVDNKPTERFPLGPLVHWPASAFLRAGSPVADAPIELAKEAIGTSIAAERFGAEFFGDGAHPSSIVYSDQELTEDGAKNIKNAVVGAMVGREPAVLGSGLKYEQIQIDPKDSQFIDLLQFEVLQACRFWGVPPVMAYAAISGQNVTYANVNQADLQYLKYSLGIWLADMEDGWAALLGNGDQVKFNVDALLRMDAPTRANVHQTGIRNGWYSVNEVRSDLDKAPIADGDLFLWPPYRAFPIEEDE